MAVTTAIPLPESGADALVGGMSSSQNMINSIMNNKYNQGQLSVAQQAEARAQSLLPKMLQKYEDEHGRAASDNYVKDMYNTIVSHEYANARPDLFGGRQPQQQTQSSYGEPAPTQVGQPNYGQQPRVINIESHSPRTNGRVTPSTENPNPNILTDETRQRLISALRDPNIPMNEKQQISEYLVANPTQAQSRNVIPAQNGMPSQVLSDENRKKLEDFIVSGQASPEDVAQIKQFLASQTPVSPGTPQGNQIAAPGIQQPNQIPGQQQGQPPVQQDDQKQGQPQLTNQNPSGEHPIQNINPYQQPQAGSTMPPMNTGQGSYSDTKNPMGVTPETTITPAKAGDEWKDRLAGVGEFEKVKSKIDPKTGIIVREYPSGRMTMQKMSIPGVDSPESISMQKAYGKKTGELMGDMETSLVKAEHSGDTLDRLGSEFNNPTLKGIQTNPYFMGKQLKYIYEKVGDPAQKRLIGNILTDSGQVIADMAGNFKGQFRVGEQALIMSMKPNPEDTIDVAKGKLESLMMMREMFLKRGEIELDLMRKGMTPHEAAKMSGKQVNSSLMKKMIQDKLGITQDMLDEKEAQIRKDEEQQKKQASQEYAQPDDMVSVRDNQTNTVTKMTRAEYNKLVGSQ